MKKPNCLVCEYRSTFENGKEFFVHKAKYQGLALDFGGVVPLCEEHLSWVYPEDKGSIRKLYDN